MKMIVEVLEVAGNKRSNIMKKILFGIVIVALLTGCGSNVDTELNKITAERDALAAELATLKGVEAEADSTQKESVVVSVVNKTVTPQDYDNWIFGNYAHFDFLLENNTDKEIKGVEGKLTIKDMFGKKIRTLRCDFTGLVIDPNGSLLFADELSYDCNEYNDNDMKIFSTAFEDLQFDYKVTQVVFSDGTMEQP